MNDNAEIDVQQDALADLFTLPAPYSGNPQIVRWHTEMVSRLQREAAGLPMSTAQIQLLERISFMYVAMRYREIQNDQISPREQKEHVALWHSMHDTFTRSIEKHKDQVLRDMVLTIQGVIEEVFGTIPDEALRRQLHQQLREGFAEKGL